MKVKQLIFFNIKIHSIEQEMNWYFWKIIHIHTHIQFKLFLDSKVMFISCCTIIFILILILFESQK